MASPPSPERHAWPDPVAIAAGIVVAVAAGLRAGRLCARAINPDEFEHLHSAWSLVHGLWPYRDYYEHHTPWLWLALAPFLALVNVDNDPDRAVMFILTARGAMWILGSVAIALTFRLAQVGAGTATGWLAAALLSVTLVFVEKTIEIRPDVPAVVCLLGSWALTAGALRRARVDRGTGWRLFAGGVLLGGAVLFTQKALFSLPATAVVLLWWVLDRRETGTPRARASGVAVFGAGVIVPVAITLAVFAAHTGIAAFVEFNLQRNVRWVVRFSPLGSLQRIFAENGVLVCLSVVGWVRAARRLRAADALSRGDAALVLQTIALLVGAFAIPVPHLQYFLMLLPITAILAAQALQEGAEALAFRLHRLARPAIGRASAAILGLAAVTVPPMVGTAGGLHPRYPALQDQLGRMRLVYALTRPGDTVMDGFTGAGVFRPHAYYYFFLHNQIRALLTGPEMDDLRRALRDGEIAPEVILFDLDLRRLSPDFAAFVEENYEPAGDPLVWRRKDLALDGAVAQGRIDVGRGPTAVLVGRGWTPPEEVHGRWLRRTRGRRSTLRLPLRQPVEALVIVHARPEGATSGARLGLVVNDRPCGEQALIAGWSDYAFHVGASAWREGVNRVRLTHTTDGAAPGDAGDAGDRPEDAAVVVAVDSIRVVPD
jgi:Dolichyl-phosphate-mannose-protein mannosyltransferase